METKIGGMETRRWKWFELCSRIIVWIGAVCFEVLNLIKTLGPISPNEGSFYLIGFVLLVLFLATWIVGVTDVVNKLNSLSFTSK